MFDLKDVLGHLNHKIDPANHLTQSIYIFLWFIELTQEVFEIDSTSVGWTFSTKRFEIIKKKKNSNTNKICGKFLTKSSVTVTSQRRILATHGQLLLSV